MGLGQAAAGLAVGGGGGRADSAVALGGDGGTEQGVAQSQEAVEEAALELVEAEALRGSLFDEGDEVSELALGLEEGLLLRQDQGWPPGGGHRAVAPDVLPPGGLLRHRHEP